MKTLACNDVDPSLNCDYVAKGETMDLLMADVKAHMQTAHAEKFAAMSGMSDADMMKMVADKVQDDQPAAM
jgi:predicted small metal-binding protein